MVCCWESLLGILPAWIREDVNRLGKEELQELRLRLDRPPQLILRDRRILLRCSVHREDISFCLNAASQYSPWAAASVSEGYLTAEGGHRIGICGETILKEGTAAGIRNPSSLCIRIARDFPGIARKAADLTGSILILGAPGWGKTTLLRDLIRLRSRKETVAVADERMELFPNGFDRGLQTDILTGCQKSRGIMQLLRTMGPQTIAVDEITVSEDCRALLSAHNCGVSLLATAHAGSLKEFRNREVNRPLLQQGVFKYVLILHKDQTYEAERMTS